MFEQFFSPVCGLIDFVEFGNKDDDIEFNSAQEFQYDGDTSLYEDEETQQFYENLLDLRAVLPQILLKDAPKPGTSDNSKDGDGTEGETKGCSSAVILENTQYCVFRFLFFFLTPYWLQMNLT